MIISRMEGRWIWLQIIFALIVLGQAPAWADAEIQDIDLIRAAVKLREEQPDLFAGSQGIVVLALLPGAEADKAGLQRGDIIIRYGGEAISSLQQFAEQVDNLPADTKVELAYLRDEETRVAVINSGIDSLTSFVGQYLVKTALENPLLQDVRTGMLNAWQKGEEEFRAFVQKNKHRISHRFIVNMSLSASQKRRGELLDLTLIAAEETGNEETIAEVSYRYGRFLALYLRDPARAIKYYRKALASYGKTGDSHSQGEVSLSMGKLYFDIHKITEALEFCQKALAFYVEADDPSDQNVVYRVMGDILRLTGNYPEALASYRTALSFYVKTKNLTIQGACYEDIGLTHLCTGHYAEALTYFQKALHCYSQQKYFPIAGVKESVLLYMGHTHYYTGNYAEALRLYQKAQSLFAGAKLPLRQGDACLGKGQSHYHIGNHSEALESYDQAHSLYVRSGSIESQAYALFGKAKVLAKMNKKDQAVSLYDDALTLLEQVRRRVDREEFKPAFLEKVTENYEAAIHFMIQNGCRDKAFRYAESMKARLFLEQLNEGWVELEKGIDPDLKQQRDSLEKKLARLKVQIQRAISAEEATKEAALRKAWQDRAVELENLKQTIRLKNPLYAQVEYPQPVNLAALQKKVLRPDELLLEYFIANGSVYCFVVGRNVYEIVLLPIDSQTLKKEVQALADHLRTEPTPGDNREVNAATEKRTHRLYQALLEPLAKHTTGRNLIIVPDGSLVKLPFEVLRTDDGYAIERHAFTYVQSASVLEMLRTYDHQQGTGGFIGFGDPVYDYESFKAGKSELNGKSQKEQNVIRAAELTRNTFLRSGGQLHRLPGSNEEVTVVADMFKEANLRLRLGAREEVAKSGEMDKYAYIHYAARGILDERMQAIALSQVPDAKEDGFLTLREIMNSRYAARLVVLSASRASENRMVRGEGVTSLARALMYAGTPAAMVSLWDVSDAGTRELMERFYQAHLTEGHPPVAALRLAKLQMLKDGDFHHPYYWVAFVLYGE